MKNKIAVIKCLSVAMVVLFSVSFAKAEGSAEQLPILVYHKIQSPGDESSESSVSITLERFESQMKYLHESGYTTLSMDDVVRFLQGEYFPEKIVAIHFDDGWKSQQKVLPILNRYGFKASFFVITEGSSAYMSWNDLKQIAKNSHYQVLSHTMTHPWKKNDTLLDWVEGRTKGKGAQEARWELMESKEVLEEKLGKPVLYLAWPANAYNGTLVALAQEAGYKALLMTTAGPNRSGDDLLHIHRTMVDGSCDIEGFKKTLSDGLARHCGADNLTAEVIQPEEKNVP